MLVHCVLAWFDVQQDAASSTFAAGRVVQHSACWKSLASSCVKQRDNTLSACVFHTSHNRDQRLDVGVLACLMPHLQTRQLQRVGHLSILSLLRCVRCVLQHRQVNACQLGTGNCASLCRSYGQLFTCGWLLSVVLLHDEYGAVAWASNQVYHRAAWATAWRLDESRRAAPGRLRIRGVVLQPGQSPQRRHHHHHKIKQGTAGLCVEAGLFTELEVGSVGAWLVRLLTWHPARVTLLVRTLPCPWTVRPVLTCTSATLNTMQCLRSSLASVELP